jgi:hypothetical protein
MRTIGLDVHKRFAEVAILDQGERVVRRGECQRSGKSGHLW